MILYGTIFVLVDRLFYGIKDNITESVMICSLVEISLDRNEENRLYTSIPKE